VFPTGHSFHSWQDVDVGLVSHGLDGWVSGEYVKVL